MVQYETARVAVDAAIFTLRGGALSVLLHKREKPPFEGKHELLGGLLRGDETAEDTLAKKLKETFGRDDIYFTQFAAFTAPGRDPRCRTVSVGFIALVGWDKVEGLQGWFPCDALPQLAFDHRGIIESALSYLRQNCGTLIVRHFLPERFPLNRLQEAYELIEGARYDNRNFRKRMLGLGIVERTKGRERGVSHRPAVLYRFR